MNIAVIPAKKESKGLPGKNMKDFFGKSLVQRAIESAQIEDIDEIFVSTDSTEIINSVASATWDIPVQILSRPSYLTLPAVQVDEVVLFDLRKIQTRYYPTEIGFVVVLQPTSVLRTTEHVLKAVQLYKAWDDPFSPGMSGFWSNKYHYTGDKLRVGSVNHDAKIRHGRQFLRPRESLLFVENGAIYIASADYIGEYKTFRSNSPIPFEMPEEDSIEIDTEYDWKKAELRYKEKQNGNNS